MRFQPLGSGSSGNATLVEFGSVRLLIDAGLSARALGQRLEAVGVSPSSIDAIFLSHEHQDHARGAELFSRKHGVRVICAAAALEAMDLSRAHLAAFSPLPEGGQVDLGTVQVESFPVPHDAAHPVGFLIRGEGLRVGIVTDLGHATTLVTERLRGCQLLMVEANHDRRLLHEGPYPWSLKQRVSGRLGHLSNDEAADLIRHTADEDCQAVVLAHLSDKNNSPDLARRAAARAVSDAGARRVSMRVATRKAPTPAIHL